MLHKIQIVDWGRTRYENALNRQREWVEKRRNEEICDQLIFTEHEAVYTIGLRTGAREHLKWTEEKCRHAGIAIFQSNRGGDITYHGPGQIVAYPIISLRHKKDLHAYLRDLEQVVINSLQYFGLKSGRRAGKTGIWLENRKVCAIGVAVRSWITYHGFALNVTPELEHFNGIVPCGITDGTVTSLEKEMSNPIEIDQVKARLAVEFQNIFQNIERQDAE